MVGATVVVEVGTVSSTSVVITAVAEDSAGEEDSASSVLDAEGEYEEEAG